jgi:hypothetical protein
MTDLPLALRIVCTTYAHNAYLSAVEQAFGWNHVDYAMLMKLYGSSSGAGRCCPPDVVGIEKRTIIAASRD